MVLLALRAPAQARRVRAEMRRFAERGMFGIGRTDPEGRPNVRYWSVPPQVVSYIVRGDELVALQVLDSRQRREPWPNPPPSRKDGFGQ